MMELRKLTEEVGQGYAMCDDVGLGLGHGIGFRGPVRARVCNASSWQLLII
jgi:hypothetical protein